MLNSIGSLSIRIYNICVELRGFFCITLKIGGDIESLGQDISSFWIFLIILYLMVIIIILGTCSLL